MGPPFSNAMNCIDDALIVLVPPVSSHAPNAQILSFRHVKRVALQHITLQNTTRKKLAPSLLCVRYTVSRA